jgi:raffinose/stachyose/melibiose transport system permease protein
MTQVSTVLPATGTDRNTAVGPPPSPPLSLRLRRSAAKSRKVGVLLVAFVWFVVVAAPVYYMVVVSIEPSSGFLTSNPWFPTRGVTLSNLSAVVHSGFLHYLLNSIIVAVGATVLCVALSIFCAYAIVVRASRITGVVFRAFLVGFAVPIQALMIPLYVEVLKVHLYDSLLGLILPMAAFSLPITILVLVNFFRDVPRSLIEAMQLDGAGPVRILRSLAVPISWPAVVTVGLFDFIAAWNNFLFPLILTQSSKVATLPLSVFNFEGNHYADVPEIIASVTLSTLPLLLLYLSFRRQIVSGLAAGFGS